METLNACIMETLNIHLRKMTVSGPRKADSMKRYTLRPVQIRERLLFQLEGFSGTQVFHENLTREEAEARIGDILSRYRNVDIFTDQEEISARISKKGKAAIRRKSLKGKSGAAEPGKICPDPENVWARLSHNRAKHYILEEGRPVPFLVDLGVMNDKGQIIRKRYDKFRQINRFLEFIEDILPELGGRSKDGEITILDFGCGKSYLTFAMYYYLHVLKEYDIRIVGLDLKKKVIRDCNQLAEKYGYEKLTFLEGRIEDYEDLSQVDMVVTLHACDTATDYALEKAVRWNAKVILSVPCCQHELNSQYDREDPSGEPFAPISDYGILQERFSSLATDGIRAKALEAMGYRTQILEFIDMEHTPKNLLIRAVLRDDYKAGDGDPFEEIKGFCKMFAFDPTIVRLLEEGDRQ